MAENIDPRTLTSWEDAFQYPTPVVRRFEQQLHIYADENREKLRSLVGSNYRGLLKTAEHTMEMDQAMNSLQAVLEDMSRNCTSRAMEKRLSNFTEWKMRLQSEEKENRSFTSQLALLQACPVVISRIINQRGSSLLGAKVLVISRLLHKALGKLPDPPPYLESLRSQLASLRGKLRRQINRSISRSDGRASHVVEDLCALALATSSTPRDVLRQFLKARKQSLIATFDNAQEVRPDVLQGLHIYIATLRDSHNIFPKKLAESLLKLKAGPLVQDDGVRSVLELNLDMHSKWLSDEVRNFTPWPRHDELRKSETDQEIAEWAHQAFDHFLNGVKEVLANMLDLPTIVQLRRDLIQEWLSNGNVSNLNYMHGLDELRGVFRDRMKSLIRAGMSELRTVCSELKGLLDSPELTLRPSSIFLWNFSPSTTSLTDGAFVFKQVMRDRSHGRSGALLGVMKAFNEWLHILQKVQVVIKDMRDAQWVEEPIDVTDEELAFNSMHALLSEDDPQALTDWLRDCADDAIANASDDIYDFISRLTTREEPAAASQTALLVRALREFSCQLSAVYTPSRLSGPTPIWVRSPFGDSRMTAPLLIHISETATSKPLQEFRDEFGRFLGSRRKVARELWEGTPLLPTQPSPMAFKFLLNLCKAMSSLGDDLWAPEAVKVLKAATCKRLCAVWRAWINHIDDQVHDQEKKNTVSEIEPLDLSMGIEGTGTASVIMQLRRDRFLQLAFDFAYFSRALGSQSERFDATEDLGALSAALATKAEADSAALGRIDRSALDYWRRTYLLFALLAQP